MALDNLQNMPAGLILPITPISEFRSSRGSDNFEEAEDAKLMTILKSLKHKKAQEGVLSKKREKKKELDLAQQKFVREGQAKLKSIKRRRESDVLHMQEDMSKVRNTALELQMRIDEFNIGLKSRQQVGILISYISYYIPRDRMSTSSQQ